MAASVTQTGYFSIVRWRRDVARDEAKNVAVILVEPEGQFGGVRSAPLSAINQTLRKQGILDAVLTGLRQKFASEVKPTLADIRKLHETFNRSLIVTEPKPTAVPDPQATLNALYKALVAPHLAAGKVVTKGRVLSQAEALLIGRGLTVRRDDYYRDFGFDLIIESGEKPRVVEALSFATPANDFSPVEHDAGHFLYAMQHVGVPGFAVIQPPSDVSSINARRSHERVLGWLESSPVPWFVLSDLRNEEIRLPL